MIKKADGTFMIVTDEELDALVKDNKIGIEYAKAMGGKVMDYTQKPIRVLKEWEEEGKKEMEWVLVRYANNYTIRFDTAHPSMKTFDDSLSGKYST